MLKKLGAVAASTAAGMLLLGGVASAAPAPVEVVEDEEFGQVGLLNLNNIDILHNVNAVLGVCDNNINVLGVQVPIQDSLDGIAVPILSPGETEAEGEVSDPCATGGIVDGGTSQEN